MAQQAVTVGYGIPNGKKPASPMILIEPALVTRENVNAYKGLGIGASNDKGLQISHSAFKR